ncbi:integrase [Lachnospiraceae bacterium PM6-15]|uniref:tyrosine-type recombinase/integrase n=1 Tax=Ohessyouella blattaphilus TaxID=2949333 RepID=UPI003E2057E2
MAVDKRNRKLPKGIRQRYDGFEGRFMYKGASYLVHGDTITATQKEMTELKYKLEHGLYLAKSEITLNDWFATWLNEYKRNKVKLSTVLHYQSLYDTQIIEKLGAVRVRDIRGEHIQTLYNDMARNNYSSAYIEGVATLMKSCLKQATKNGIIERNPTDITELPKGKAKAPRKALTKEEQALFMEYAKESFLYNLFAVMLRTGLRVGEITGLKYSDVDKKRKVLTVQRTLLYKKIDGEYVFYEEEPKTKTSKREIPLTAATLELLEAQRHYWGFKVEKIDRYLFCRENGEAMGAWRVKLEIKHIIKRIRTAGHEFEHISPHVFRHTFATRAIEAGMQPQVLKTILGHSSLAMTMDLYSHVLPDTKANEMEKIAGAF